MSENRLREDRPVLEELVCQWRAEVFVEGMSVEDGFVMARRVGRAGIE